MKFEIHINDSVYEVAHLGENAGWIVKGPDDFRQTWRTRGECEDAARDHAKGIVVSVHDYE